MPIVMPSNETPIVEKDSTRWVSIGFALAIGLMVALILFAISRMEAMYSVVERVVGVQHPAIESLYVMHGAARDRSLLLHDIVNTDDPFDREEKIQHFTELGAVFGSARQKFMALNLTGNRLALIEAQRQHTERAVPLQWQAVDLAKVPDKRAANQLLVESAIPAQNRVIADLKELLDLELAESVQLSQAAELQLQQAYRLMVIGGVGAVSLTLLVMVFVNRRMSTLVLRLVETVSKLRAALKDVEYEKLALDKHAIVSITDADGRITYVNDKFVKTCGYSQDELLGQNHRFLKTDSHPPAFFQDMWATITHGKVWQGEVCNRARDGRIFWMATTIVPFLDDAGCPYQYVAIRTDITDIKAAEKILIRDKEELGVLVHERTSELAAANKTLLAEVARRQELEEELRKMASIDKLTGIFNRRAFDEAVKKEMERAKRYLHPTRGRQHSHGAGAADPRQDPRPRRIRPLGRGGIYYSGRQQRPGSLFAAGRKTADACRGSRFPKYRKAHMQFRSDKLARRRYR